MTVAFHPAAKERPVGRPVPKRARPARLGHRDSATATLDYLRGPVSRAGRLAVLTCGW
jgi:hypothetical protein